MGCRRQSRTATQLNVNLCGTDTQGRAFIERVRTGNISRDGAFLENVKSQVHLGDIVVLRCDGNTGRFRVIWEKRSDQGRKLGLSRVLTQNHANEAVELLHEHDDFERPRVRSRRHAQRYECEVAAELHVKHVKIPMWVTTMNLGEGGCAVQTVVSVPENTELNAAFWLEDVKIWVQGVVVSSLYGLGTGIRFTGMSKAAREQLQNFLSRRATATADRRAGAEDSLEISLAQQPEVEKIELILPGSPLYR